MSPEAVGGKKVAPNGAGMEADLWALGCCLYQFQGGESPFKAGSQYLSFLKIQKGTFLYPPHVDSQLANLIRLLIVVRLPNFPSCIVYVLYSASSWF
jgi:serine/threonine protein kinase